MGLSSQKCSIFCGFYILVIRSFWCNNRKGIFHQIFFWSSQERQLIRSFWSQQERYNSSDLSGLRMCIDFLCTAELPSHGLSTSVYNLSGSGTCWVIYPSRPIYTYIYMYRHALWVWGLYIYIYKSLSLYIYRAEPLSIFYPQHNCVLSWSVYVQAFSGFRLQSL